MNITNSFVAGTVHLRSLLRFPDISACFQTPGDLAAMSACPLCFFVATWSQSSSPTCSKPGTHCTHHLKPYMYNKRSHKIGVESGCPTKRARQWSFWNGMVFVCQLESEWHCCHETQSPKSCRKGFQHQSIGESECGGPLPRILSWTQGSIIVTSDGMNCY